MRKYQVIANLKHNSKSYQLGDAVEMTVEQAEACSAVGGEVQGIDAVDTVAVADPKPVPELVAAITNLNVDVADNWTADGRPTTDALSQLLGYTVTAAERDAAWLLYQQKLG